MVEQYDYDEIEEKLELRIVTGESSDIQGQLLTVTRGELESRRVDYFIRIIDGSLQERYDFYDGERMIGSSDWNNMEENSVQGGKIKSSHSHTGETYEPVPWAEGHVEKIMPDFITEVWEEQKASDG